MDPQPGPRRRIVIQPVTTQRSRGPKMGRMGFLLLALLLLVGLLLTLCGPPPQPRTLSSGEGLTRTAVCRKRTQGGHEVRPALAQRVTAGLLRDAPG